jgi:integral membrane protein
VASRPLSSGELTRFRVFAWATGVALLLLVLVAMPLKYLADSGAMVRVVAPVHGWLYVGYVVTAFVVAYRLRWSPGRTVLLLLAGTVPFMSFVAERRVLRQVRPARPAADQRAADQPAAPAAPAPPAPPA